MSNWTHPCCEACWVERNLYYVNGEVAIRQPFLLKDPGIQKCCYCGNMTILGCWIREDPTKVAFPMVEENV